MNRTEQVRQILALEALAVAAKLRAAEHRAALEETARAELKEQGTAPTWRLPEMASVILPVSEQKPYVDDAAALLTWCKERHPTEVETIEQVRASFQSALLRRLVVDDGAVVDPATGEIVPGMAVSEGGQPRALTIRPTPVAREAFVILGRRVLEELLAGPLAIERGAEQ